MVFSEEIIFFGHYIADSFLPAMWQTMKEIVSAPSQQTELLWTVLPLVAALLMMELYFGRYKTEELGWNTAVANGLLLVFVSLTLFRHLLLDREISLAIISDLKTFLAAAVLILGVWLFIVDFFHLLPKKIAFRISSSLPINFLAYIAVILVRTDILDKSGIENYSIVACAVLALFLCTMILFGLVHSLEPKTA